jgi:hypothetical protein
VTAENWFNPFDNPELVAGYETWYETDGALPTSPSVV